MKRLLVLLFTLAMVGSGVPAITIDYPSDQTIFPPEFPAPLFLWRDSDPGAKTWQIEVTFADGAGPIRVDATGEGMRIGEIDQRCISPLNKLPELTPEQAAAHTWRPDAATWATIKKHSIAKPAIIKITRADSTATLTFSTSKDEVGAPILFRDVPLMPSEQVDGVIKPLPFNAQPLIAWRLRHVDETGSRLLMDGLHHCANCHSISADGKTMGMDVDGPLSDKGLYAIVPIRQNTVIRNEDVVAWSSFRGKLGGQFRVGFLSQVSPDGQYVVTMINDPGKYSRKRLGDLEGNYYVANFKDHRFLQVFYATRGILAYYSKKNGKLLPLPGADDPKYVHTGAFWSPDGKYLVFSRAEARNAYDKNVPMAQFANDPNERPMKYDLYRIPFNDGKGGTPEPLAGASNNGMSNSFPKISPDGKWIVYVQARNGLLMRPDSQLYIVPAAGGEARRMNCNTRLMNSWHSFSPNSRWLVFSSKSWSPYTQMFLTHIDENGNDSPAILIENATAANRAVNIPEFVNIPKDGLQTIAAPVSDFYRIFDVASELADKGNFAEAAVEWRKALDLDPEDYRVRNNLGLALSSSGRVDEAIVQFLKAAELNPEDADAENNLGSAFAKRGKVDEAILHFQKSVELNPDGIRARSNLGAALAEAGRSEEAIAQCRRVLEINPDDAEAHNNIAIALARSGELAEAIPHFQKALDGLPARAEIAGNLGFALAQQGRVNEAVPLLQKAVQTNPDASELQFMLGRVLAQQKDFASAIRHLERAMQLTGGRQPVVLDTTAAVYAAAGRYSDAVRVLRGALDIAVEMKNERIAALLRERIAEFDAKATSANGHD